MVISVVSFSFSWCSTGGPEAQLSAECWLSLPHLVTNGSPKLLGDPRAPSTGWWHSLPHLVSNSSDLQLNRGPEGPLRWAVAFSTTSWLWLLWSQLVWLPVFTELYNSSIAHSTTHSIFGTACLIVMQFSGHSLSKHQSMSVSWAFTLSHFVSQIRLRDFFRLLAIGMCHFLPVHHLGMACLAGSRVHIQQYIMSERKILHFRTDWK